MAVQCDTTNFLAEPGPEVIAKPTDSRALMIEIPTSNGAGGAKGND
jgi:hypothetical protein